MKITEIKKQNGTSVYRASVYLGIDSITGKKIKTSVTGRTKTEVKEKAKHAQFDFKSNGSTKKKVAEVKTFRELSCLWLDSYELTVKPQSYKATVNRLEVHVYPILGDMKIDRISPSDIQMLINNLSKYYVNFKAIRSIIRKIFQHGIMLELTNANPARDIILPRSRPKNTNKIKFIDPEHLKAFLENMEKQQHKRYSLYFESVLYKLLLATGIRVGEACALEWADIDLEKGTLTISKTYSKDAKQVSTTKTKAGNRTISIDSKTINLLKLYHIRQRQVFLEIGARAPLVVFATPNREYFDLAIRQARLDNRCKEAGVPRFTFHAFRHTHASLLLNAGISYKELQYRLGHANIAMTLDVYSHLSPEKEKDAISYYEKAMMNL